MDYCELSSDEDLARDLIKQVRRQVNALPLERRNIITLMVSGGLAEAAAYDLASAEQPETTAALILCAAELDRHADRQRRRAGLLP